MVSHHWKKKWVAIVCVDHQELSEQMRTPADINDQQERKYNSPIDRV